MTAEETELAAALDAVPRFPLAVTPTPLEELPGLADALSVRTVLVKRDDLTGLALGGNKVRMLEYFVGDALAHGCDTLIAGGGAAQSNHARLCAAAARRARLEPVTVLRRPAVDGTPNGNQLVTELLGGTVHWSDVDPRMTDRFALSPVMDQVAQEYRTRGHRPYVIYSSVHPLGVLGYLRCALELDGQLRERGVKRPVVISASQGSVVTGLLLGAALMGLDWQVIGAAVGPMRPDAVNPLHRRLERLARDAAAMVGVNSPLTASDFEILDEGGPAYGTATEAAWEAITLCARRDALLLDPVYTGKGMAGLIRAVRAGRVPEGMTPVFVHTGGVPALFSQAEAVMDAIGRVS